jgi:hypothetical protein
VERGTLKLGAASTRERGSFLKQWPWCGCIQLDQEPTTDYLCLPRASSPCAISLWNVLVLFFARMMLIMLMMMLFLRRRLLLLVL